MILDRWTADCQQAVDSQGDLLSVSNVTGVFDVCRLTAEEKYELVRSIGEECIQDDELRALLEHKPQIVAYDGFEPSGRMHIAQVTWEARAERDQRLCKQNRCVCFSFEFAVGQGYSS